MQSNTYLQRTYKRKDGVEVRDRKRSKLSKLSRISIRANRTLKESNHAYNS